jgi:glycosyltransferase involved in cell wall biosynthesis
VTQRVETERSTPYQASIGSPVADRDLADFPLRTNRGTTPQPARVLIVECNVDGTVGGSHQALFDLAVRVDPARFEPIVMFYQDNVFVSRLRARGVQVVLFDDVINEEQEVNRSGRRVAKLVGIGKAVLRRRRELHRLKIDLLHLNNSPGVGNDDWLPAARLVGIPCVVTAMGYFGRPKRMVHRWLFRRFDLYLAISHYMADVLRREGVDPDRIELVYLGVDFETLRARMVRSREAVRAELGVAANQLLVLMVGNIRAWKGQREVVAALRLLPEKVRARLRVCFAGATADADSAYEAELRDDIAVAGLRDCVSLIGSRSDVPDLYAAADIAIHASTTPEPFGLVVPEAMALKCAVIAASTGGPSEVVLPGTGILCDPKRPEEYASALEQLVRDEWLRQAMSEAAPARAAMFSVDRTVLGTERVYQRALEQFSRGFFEQRQMSVQA